MARLAFFTAGLAASGLIAAGLAASALDAPPKSSDARSDLEALLWPGAAAPARIDQPGRALAPAVLNDKVVVLAFVRTDCLITCVVRTLDLDRVARAIPDDLRGKVAFLAVSTDPARDDPGTLSRFAEALTGDKSPLRYVTGDGETNAALAAWLRYPAAQLPEPPPTVVVFDRRGQAAMSYGTDPLDRERLLRDIAALERFENGIGRPPRAEAASAAP